MQGKTSGIAYIFLILSSFIISATAIWATDTGTIVLKSGERLEDVSYKIDNFYKVVKIEFDDTKRNIGFSDIEAILDADGNNKAPELLGRWYRPASESQVPIVPEDEASDTTEKSSENAEDEDSAVGTPDGNTTTWYSRDDPVIRKATKRPWRLGLCFAGNFSAPFGDWYRGLNSGWGLEGDVMFTLNHYLALQFSFSHAGFDYDENEFYLIPVPGYTITSQDIDFSANRYLVSAMYYHRTGRESRGRLLFFAWTGLGAVQHKSTFKIGLRNENTGVVEYDTGNSSISKFATTTGAALMWLLSENFGLDFSASLHVVYAGRTDDDWYAEDDMVYGYIFNIKLGLVTLF